LRLPQEDGSPGNLSMSLAANQLKVSVFC